ncbi:TPA: cytochrome b [Pseudomonas aeruginosa]|uniref:Cytochrome b n=1 Tax=Pseudomonas aeruginosa TaxID=287 RepID=A0ABD7K6N0_PSEAI|nr:MULTISPECIES: cytochrome b [Pseudomonas aeruginosa group]KFF36023.1 cytochrome B561 [Pseudomonas aeruginosa VRFPA01]KSC50165.1 cytochrome b [Pseudomonas paraeruginosa]KSL14777.1 cytochrome b [Pseudomonas aeruginosa]MBH8717677.1 cytochrome b [Pseudomonas aeruginosa]MBH9343721.1 cytochrome b [Pseudomonas aeruginosa]
MSIRRYSPSQITLHWLSAIAVLLIIALPYGADLFAGPLGGKGNVFTLHKSLGVAVLLLTLARLVLRRTQGTPDTLAACPGWQRFAAKSGHALLYAVLIVMPLSGMLAGKRPLDLFWLVQVGPFDLPEAFKAFAGGTHVTLQYLLFALILGHAVAAIWHHRVQKDDVLRAMLPQRGA